MVTHVTHTDRFGNAVFLGIGPGRYTLIDVYRDELLLQSEAIRAEVIRVPTLMTETHPEAGSLNDLNAPEKARSPLTSGPETSSLAQCQIDRQIAPISGRETAKIPYMSNSDSYKKEKRGKNGIL